MRHRKPSCFRLTAAFFLSWPVALGDDRSCEARDSTVPSAPVLEYQRDGLVYQFIELEVPPSLKGGIRLQPFLPACLDHTDRIPHFTDFHSIMKNPADTLQFFDGSTHSLSVSFPVRAASTPPSFCNPANPEGKYVFNARLALGESEMAWDAVWR